MCGRSTFFFLFHSIFKSHILLIAANREAKAERSMPGELRAVPAVFQRMIKLKSDTNLT